MSVCYYILIHAWLVMTVCGRGEDYQQSVSIRHRRHVTQDGMPKEMLSFEAFGRGYDVNLDDVEKRKLDDVEIYVGMDGDFKRENSFDDDVDLYQDHNTLLAVRKRRSKEDGEWHLEVDGWVRDGDDEVFLESQPWMNVDSDVSRHVVSRVNTPRNNEDDIAKYVNKRDDVDNDLSSFLVQAYEAINHYRRDRRNDNEQYRAVVDLLILVDNAIYRQSFKQFGSDRATLVKLKTYYSMLAALVDIRYSKIDDTSINIRVRLSKLFVAKDRMSSPWAEYNVRMGQDNNNEPVLDPNIALNSLRDWLLAEYDVSLRGVQYDHVMAFTGYQLMSESGRVTTGMAYIGTICQTKEGYSTSLIAEEGAFLNVGTAVHELAHSLGARHDGAGDNSQCPPSDNYIMAPFNTGNPEVLSNYFRFSSCSLNDFKATIGSKKASCLRDSDPDRIPQKLPGQIYTPDKQCRDLFGPGSGMCEKVIKKNPAQICVRLWCLKPTDPSICITNVGLSALYGATCGENKICKQGECVEDTTQKKSRLQNVIKPKTKYVPSNQLEQKQQQQDVRPAYGPSAPCQKDTNPRYCRRLINNYPDACERPEFQSFCCYSCYYIGRE